MWSNVDATRGIVTRVRRIERSARTRLADTSKRKKEKRKKKKKKKGKKNEKIANRAKNTLEKYLPTYKCATTKICIMYTRLLKPFYQICHYLIISVVF